MDKDIQQFYEDDSEDALFIRIQEESLRYYNEVELPRRAVQTNEATTSAEVDDTRKEPKPQCSKNINIKQSPLKDVFYKGSELGAEGFHLAAGETYVYPTNYPIRKYQQTIIHSALFHNTLVSLPTGLGKTFIGAVVMYNYYRWFPQGKIVFMAPTKPLVAQQIRACHSIMAIPVVDTVEMTGTMNPVDRQQHWKNKRVFFLTPQVMANDLRSGVCPAKLFKCVVIDEAHRATKEYSFCHVIKELEKAGAVFRILALSATPGSNVKAVVEVVQNLRISTLELRGEDSPDVIPYTHEKEIQQVPLSLSKHILDFMEQFLVIFERFAKNLRESRLITCNVRNLTRFQLLKASEKIRSRPPNGITKQRAGLLMADFMVCIALAHGLELLQTYGLRAFYQYFTGCEDEENRKAAFTRLNHDAEFHQLMSNLQIAVNSPMDQVWSHPKHEHLVSILKQHFGKAQEQGTDTKVIIFCQYRVVVTEVYELLLNIHPTIKPVMFVGQGVGKDKNGLPQKKQIEVMKQFREGKTNVMIATCVAEEGLDIGSVDLLVLMEVQRSPVRLVQRLGRTGRHRQGHCVVLLTQGREVQKFMDAMATKKSFVTNIQKSKVLADHLYKDEPNMVPPYLMPKMQLVHINVPDRITPAKHKKQSDIRQALLNKLEDTEITESGFLAPEQLVLVRNELNSLKLAFNSLTFTKPPTLLCQRENGPPMSVKELFEPSFCQQSEFNDWNRVQQETYLVSHSRDSETLCHLLNKAEAMQLGQHTDLNSQMDISSLVPKKNLKKNKDANIENDIMHKKKKVGKDKKHGMDIRTCMALAADKIRLTQEKLHEKDDTIFIENNNNDNITISSQQSIHFTAEDNLRNLSPNRDLNEKLNCSFCKPLFSGLDHHLVERYQPFPITIRSLAAVSLLVKNLNKDLIANIDVNNLLPTAPVLDVDGLDKTNNNNNIIFKTPQKVPLDQIVLEKKSNSIYDSPTKKELQTEVNSPNDNHEYFNFDDIFKDDDDFDFFKSSVEKFPVNSTPKNSKFSDSNRTRNKHSSFITGNHGNYSRIKQQKISHIFSKLDSGNKKFINNNVNIQDTLSSKRLISPKSPILSSQITKNKSVTNLNLSENCSSPESPILSSQLSNTHKPSAKQNLLNHFQTPTPTFSNKISFNNIFSKSDTKKPFRLTPESPILSGHISKLDSNTTFIEKCATLNHQKPNSPILSGQISSQKQAVHSKSLNKNILPSPISPVLSSHFIAPKSIFLQNPLKRKDLFPVETTNKSSKVGEEEALLCKPLDIEDMNIVLEDADETNLLTASQLFDEDSYVECNKSSKVGEEKSLLCKPLDVEHLSVASEDLDETNLVTASQLFDEDSNVESESNKKSVLEQSSMYTISQMVSKLKDIANTSVPKSACRPNLNKYIAIETNKEKNIKFGSRDEDSIFNNIDLDALTHVISMPKNINEGSSMQSPSTFKDSINKQIKGTGPYSSTPEQISPNIKDCKNQGKLEGAKQLKLFQNDTSPFHKAEIKQNFQETKTSKDFKLLVHPKLQKSTTITCDKQKSDCPNKSNPNETTNGVSSIDQTVNDKDLFGCSFPSPKVKEEAININKNQKWLSSLKTPLKKTKLMPSTPQISVKQQSDTDSESNSELIFNPVIKKKNYPLAKSTNRHRKVKNIQAFVELEADVSGAPCSSDEENTSGLDDLDESFINDLTQRPLTCVDQSSIDMHARYLESVKSPVKKLGGYKIPVMSTSVLQRDVYSQAVCEEDEDSYERDSFCCDGTELPIEDDPSVLEVAERILENNKKLKKRKRRKRKRKRTLCFNSSNEDNLQNYKRARLKRPILSDISSDNYSPVKVKPKRKRTLSSSSSDGAVSNTLKTPFKRKNPTFKRKNPHLLTSESDSDRTT